MEPSFLGFVGFLTCGLLAVRSVVAIIALIISAFKSWSEIGKLKAAMAEARDEDSWCDNVDGRLDRLDLAAGRFVDEFDDNGDQLADIDGRLDVHRLFIADASKRLAKLEARNQPAA